MAQNFVRIKIQKQARRHSPENPGMRNLVRQESLTKLWMRTALYIFDMNKDNRGEEQPLIKS